MSKRSSVILLVILLLVAAGAACSDGDGLASISRLDFDPEDHFLNVFGDVVPPVEHDYPDVVARVNGETITGNDLMTSVVQLEHDRLSFERIVSQAGLIDEESVPLLDQFGKANPLEMVINEALLRQAVLREGTLASREEVEVSLREQEARMYSARFDRTPEELAELQEGLLLYGYPATDWASDDQIVEYLRMSQGIQYLSGRVCDEPPEMFLDRDPTRPTSHDCSAFLASERAAADIEVYVRWAD